MQVATNTPRNINITKMHPNRNTTLKNLMMGPNISVIIELSCN
jgi:hypothetical protein